MPCAGASSPRRPSGVLSFARMAVRPIMHFWTAPGPEIIRVYAYLASCRFPSPACVPWNGLINADAPMVRSSPKSESAQLRRIQLCTAGDLCAPVRRRPGIAFPGIEFAGVHQRSGQFSDPLNSHEYLRIRGRSFCGSCPFTAGWATATGKRAHARRAIAGPAARLWRPQPGPGRARRRTGAPCPGRSRSLPRRPDGGEKAGAPAEGREPESPERAGIPDAGRSRWRKPERLACGSGAGRSAPSPQGGAAGPPPDAGMGQDPDF